jgi:hypothetical protein
MAEPAQDIAQGYMQISVSNMPAPGAWLVLSIEATLSIGGKTATLPIKVVSSGAGTSTIPYAAKRVSSAP